MGFGSGNHSCCFSPSSGMIGIKSGMVIRARGNGNFNIIDRTGFGVRRSGVISPLGGVLHFTGSGSLGQVRRGEGGRRRTFSIYRRLIGRRGLSVGLIRIRCSFSNDGIVFFFASSKHISFHRLMGSLTTGFRAEVRLERVNIHSRTGVLNNLKVYNRPCYYGRFLDSFRPISVGVTGRRNLSLGPAGVSNDYNELVYYLGCRRSTCRCLGSFAPRVKTAIGARGNVNIIASMGLVANGLCIGPLRDSSVPFGARHSGMGIVSNNGGQRGSRGDSG